MTLTVLPARTGTADSQALTPDSLGTFVVYINEDPQGRNVIIRHTPPRGTNSLTPTGSFETRGVTAGPWQVEGAAGNVSVVALSSPLRAAVTGATPDELRLTLSRCGLDSFIVTYTTPAPPGRRPVTERVTIRVKKRIRSTAFYDMPDTTGTLIISLRGSYPPPARGATPRSAPAQPARSGGDYLRDAVTFFDTSHGIDINLPANAEGILGSQTIQLNQSGNLPANILQQIQLQRRVTTNPRTLVWIAAREVRRGQRIISVGGRNVVVIGFSSFAAQIRQFRNIVQQYRQQTTLDTPRRQEQFLAGFRPPLAGTQRQALAAILNQTTTPETLGQTNLYLTLLHEMGHAFGLIPANGVNGGPQDTTWPDPNRGHSTRASNRGTEHCSNDQCAMWWEAEVGQAFRAALVRGGNPFDGYAGMGTSRHSRCSLYLRTCDLSDLRPFPD